jgi:hypothetical protein
MTQRNFIELIDAQAPGKGDVFIRILANLALSEYAEETRVVKSRTNVTATGSLRIALPANVLAVERVFDERGQQVPHSAHYQFMLLPPGQHGWWIEEGQLVIGVVVPSSSQGVTFQAAEAGRVFDVRFVARPAPLTEANMADELPIPEHLHGAIEARVMEKMSAGNPEQRAYWYAKWREYVRKGKQTANINQTHAAFNVLYHDV